MRYEILEQPSSAARSITIPAGTQRVIFDAPQTDEPLTTEITVQQGAQAVIVCCINSGRTKKYVEQRTLRLEAGATCSAFFWYRTDAPVEDELHVTLEANARYTHRGLGVTQRRSPRRSVITVLASGDGSTTTVSDYELALAGGHAFVRAVLEAPFGATGIEGRVDLRGFTIGEGARCDFIPELRIQSDDAHVAHGASVTSVHPESLFYLRTRGLTEAQATALYVDGIIRTFIAQVPQEDARRAILESAQPLLHE